MPVIKNEDILSLNYYKKEKFTGSDRGMRYLIQKDTENGTDVFRVHVWPGPYNFESTDDSKKITAAFPFTLDGKRQVVDYLNAQWVDFHQK